MSHWAKVTTEIKDITVLREALQQLDPEIQLLEGGTARGHENRGDMDYVIRLRGQYDIGLKQGVGFNAPHELHFDSYGGHIDREVGANCTRLLQAYAEVKITKEARRKGLSVQRTTSDDGKIRLTVREF